MLENIRVTYVYTHTHTHLSTLSYISSVSMKASNDVSFDVWQPSATSLKQSVKDRLGPLVTVNSEPSQDSGVASQVCGLVTVLFPFV